MSTSEVSVCIHGWGVRCRRILLGLAGEVLARTSGLYPAPMRNSIRVYFG